MSTVEGLTGAGPAALPAAGKDAGDGIRGAAGP